MSKTITADEVLDSRDILERLGELEDLRSDHEGGKEAWAAEFPEEAQELAALAALDAECSSVPDWSYGETLIRDDYFETYAEELADDIGAIKRDAAWPLNCIDWEKAARQLQQDYTDVQFLGSTYWVRA